MDRNPYMAIMVAAAKGRGLRLTASEVFDLSLDTGVRVAAHQGLTKDEARRVLDAPRDTAWARIPLYKVRASEDLWGYDPH